MRRKTGLTGRVAVCGMWDGRPLWADREGDPSTLDFNGLDDCQSVLTFDAKVTDGAVHLGVAE